MSKLLRAYAMKPINIAQIYNTKTAEESVSSVNKVVFLSEDGGIFLKYFYAGIICDLYTCLIVEDKNQMTYAGITWTKKDSKTLQGDWGKATVYLPVNVILDYLITEKLLTS